MREALTVRAGGAREGVLNTPLAADAGAFTALSGVRAARFGLTALPGKELRPFMDASPSTQKLPPSSTDMSSTEEERAASSTRSVSPGASCANATALLKMQVQGVEK